jgi:C1A family cysteine protease
MRTKSYNIFLFVFVIYLLKITICTGQNQKMFEMAYPKSGIISINEKYSKSIIINPFKQKESFFSLSINAKVILNSNISLIRVIFIGENGAEYLILESNYMISEQNQIEYSDYGEETAMLNGVVPDRIKIEIEDASILLETFSYNNATQNKLGSKDFTLRSKKIKNNQDIVKIDILNKQIKKKGHLWKAGETPVSLMTYQQKKQLFGGNLPNLKGFDYYKGGIFNFADSKSSKKGSASNIVSTFDWRNRHGQNWITSIKDQGTEGACWAFGAMASLEAVINLYYNQHINKDLSEQSFVSCMWGIYRNYAVEGWPAPPLSQCGINSPTNVFCNVKNLGAVEEDCYPFSNVYDALGMDNDNHVCTTAPPNGCNICGNLCPDYLQRLWKVTDFKELDPPNYYYPTNSWCELITEDSLKVNIIRNGPTAFSYPAWSHVMCFVGFDVIKQGDILNNYGLVADNDPLIGQVYWIVKNSWGAGWGENGYGNFFFDLNQDVLASVVKTPITQPVVTNYKVECTDSDGDGYCWWGIGKRPSTGCPVTSHLEEDGDDSNPLLGPYDSIFNLTIISDCPSVPLIGTITHPTCTEATGSVVFSGLPISGTWILTRSPGGAVTSGTGTSTTISGLPMGTYTFTVTNASGCTSDTSAKVVINTQPIIPTIATSSIIDASLSTALGGGNVTSDGGSAITERGVCWSTTNNPTILNSKTSDGTSIGSFTSTITDLTNGVTYHIRAYATNCTGTGYGSDIPYTHNPTGIENIQTTEISVFPNPITDILYIEYKNNNYETIKIFNSKGVLLAKGKVISPIQQFDFSKYEYGLYMLEFVKHSGESTRIKVIKT